MSCYTTLSSRVQKAEFSNYGPSEIVWQEDHRWEVGLSGVLFPTVPQTEVHPENLLIYVVETGDHRGIGIMADTCACTLVLLLMTRPWSGRKELWVC